MHEVLVNRLGGLSLPRKSVVRLTDRPDLTLDVYRGRKTTIQQYSRNKAILKIKEQLPSQTCYLTGIRLDRYYSESATRSKLICVHQRQ